jgi:hypothetical protein
LKSSSYLDLGPLYGHNEEQQKLVRTFKDGLLKKDVFAESRLLGQPPGACALVVAFNRFHNYVVGEMAIINEGNRFSLPDGMTPASPGYEKAQLKRDNDLFQTGRLCVFRFILVSHFMASNMILQCNLWPLCQHDTERLPEDYSELESKHH